jgi:signal transduction histidine kinase
MHIKVAIFKAKSLLLISWFAIIVCQPSFAQPNRLIDSLKRALKTATEDTNKVNKLNVLSRLLWLRSRYAESKKYASDALALSEKLNYKKGTAFAYNEIGKAHHSLGNYPEALKNYQASLEVSEEMGEKKGIALSYRNIGSVYDNQANYHDALKNYLASLKIREGIGDTLGIAACYNDIGEVYRGMGNYPEALKNYMASLKISEVKGPERGIARSYSNIGTIYQRQGNRPEALKNHLAALKIREKIGDRQGIAASFNNLGLIYDELGNYAEALKNHMASLKISEEDGNKKGIALCRIDIGIIYKNEGNYSEALKQWLTSLKICEEIGDKRPACFCYNNIGKAYIRLNESSKAKEYLIKGLSLSKEIGATENIKDAYDGLSQADSASGNFQQALEHYKLYTDYKDRVLNDTINRQISQMREQYESEKKDRKILQLESDKQKLENEKQISSLLLKTNQDSLSIAQAANDKTRLENERIQTRNLFNQQQIALLGDEKELQRLQIEKDHAEYALKNAEVDKKQEEVTVLTKEKAIQDLKLKKQLQAKNYFIAGLILFVVLSFFVYRNHHNRQKLNLLTLRNKIASDLHDDVGSTLSSISIFSQMAQQQSTETIPMLETIGESSRKMLDAMADIVWTINPDNDQFEKIILRMKSFAYELLGAKNIDFEFITDNEVEKINVPMEVRKNLYLIFKEATNNIVKYAQANKAMFAINGEKNNLTMMIQDNGKGFDLTKSTEGNGLKNIKKRANEIGAKLKIDSLPGNGTKIQLSVGV